MHYKLLAVLASITLGGAQLEAKIYPCPSATEVLKRLSKASPTTDEKGNVTQADFSFFSNGKDTWKGEMIMSDGTLKPKEIKKLTDTYVHITQTKIRDTECHYSYQVDGKILTGISTDKPTLEVMLTLADKKLKCGQHKSENALECS